VRAVVAIAAAVLVLATGVAPHAHDGRLGSHACLACVTATGEAARPATPDVAPSLHATAELAQPPASQVTPGFPQGAVPGQSPPRA
jgi:hypothetical protein